MIARHVAKDHDLNSSPSFASVTSLMTFPVDFSEDPARATCTVRSFPWRRRGETENERGCRVRPATRNPLTPRTGPLLPLLLWALPSCPLLSPPPLPASPPSPSRRRREPGRPETPQPPAGGLLLEETGDFRKVLPPPRLDQGDGFPSSSPRPHLLFLFYRSREFSFGWIVGLSRSYMVPSAEILFLRCNNSVKEISNFCGRNPELLPIEKRNFSFVSFPCFRC
jgi:hypothetical protein